MKIADGPSRLVPPSPPKPAAPEPASARAVVDTFERAPARLLSKLGVPNTAPDPIAAPAACGPVDDLVDGVVELARRLGVGARQLVGLVETAVAGLGESLRSEFLELLAEHAPDLAAQVLRYGATADAAPSLTPVFQDLLLAARASDDPDLQQAAGAYLAAHFDDAQMVEQCLLDDLRAGRTDDGFRSFLYGFFAALDAPDSHEAMELVRSAGLLDGFLAATLRDENGDAVPAIVTEAVGRIMETGRLDVYAETLASIPITVHDPATSGRSGSHHYNHGDDGVYLNGTATEITGNDVGAVASKLAHELFHAFAAHHGASPYSAVNEGMAIAADRYALTDGSYNVAEMVYGTKNWYRDVRNPPKPDYELGTFEDADPKLRALLEDLASRDSSGVAWDDTERLEQEYADYWEAIDRDQPWADWLAAAEAATRDMIVGRRPRRAD